MSMSNYLENKILDWLLRGQSFTPPTPIYVGLVTTIGSDSSAGTEVAYSGYARQSVTPSLSNISGTQGDATTSASSGTSGVISNNNTITFPTPPSDVASPVVGIIIMDASTSGNLLFWGPLVGSDGVTPVSRSLLGGNPVTISAATLRFALD